MPHGLYPSVLLSGNLAKYLTLTPKRDQGEGFSHIPHSQGVMDKNPAGNTEHETMVSGNVRLKKFQCLFLINFKLDLSFEHVAYCETLNFVVVPFLKRGI